VLCPLAFIFANCIVYFAGWSNVFWLYVFIVIGFLVFGIYQVSIPAERRSVISWRSAQWILPWLIGLGLISWQGQYTSSPNKVFGITLNPTLNIGGTHPHGISEWYDLILIAVFSLAIYYWAVHVALPADKVQEAVAEVEAEASIELDSHLVS
jgi:hypothetical protein